MLNINVYPLDMAGRIFPIMDVQPPERRKIFFEKVKTCCGFYRVFKTRSQS